VFNQLFLKGGNARLSGDATVPNSWPQFFASKDRNAATDPFKWGEILNQKSPYVFYFTDITKPAEGYREISGASLWSYMASKAEAARHPE